jgi:thioredoxin 1
MAQPAERNFSPPWFLIIGVFAGVALIAFIVWDAPAKKSLHVVEITQASWQKEVVESDVPVLVDFTAKWCGPCQAFAPTIDRLAKRYEGRVKVAKLDVGDNSFDKGRDLAERYGFNGIPHIIIFKGGDRPFREFSGANVSEATLAKALDAALASR